MGCDIHLHVEIKVDGEWLHYNNPQITRWYSLFANLGNTTREEASLEPPLTIKPLPGNISKTTLLDITYEIDDGHHWGCLSSDQIPRLFEWIEKNGIAKPAWEHSNIGYLYGNGFDGFHKYRADYPDWVEDFRFIFWFDN